MIRVVCGISIREGRVEIWGKNSDSQNNNLPCFKTCLQVDFLSFLAVCSTHKEINAIYSFLALGWYAFIETSLPRRPNDTARLISKSQVTARSQCLNFWYHMYGSHINQLNVYLQKPGANLSRPVWSKYGSHGDVWRPAHVLMSSSPPFKVCFFQIHLCSFPI